MRRIRDRGHESVLCRGTFRLTTNITGGAREKFPCCGGLKSGLTEREDDAFHRLMHDAEEGRVNRRQDEDEEESAEARPEH